MQSSAVRQGRLSRTHRRTSGNALIEFALVIPLLFLLIANVVNFGGMLNAWITVTHAAKNGAQYLMMGGSTLGATSATKAQVAALVAADLKNLPNSATAGTVIVCTNNNGSISSTFTNAGGSAACSSVTGAINPSDPEPTLYIVGAVDVTYTYTPIVSLFTVFGFTLTIPPTTIHRQCVMRLGGSPS
ncbi:MAG TPA: TadE/TadG family type IV pilus assembly protein [Candidatus Sulfopaludibacter sp.]|jgi:Flp pilus assembly protein TadG|nr:TadE/TadG family type IV pilus assembly protein [Candidatus Sulfopaludibacter sp.]